MRRSEFLELKWEVERQRLLIMELRQGTSSRPVICEACTALANAVADFLDGNGDLGDLRRALVASADALGEALYPAHIAQAREAEKKRLIDGLEDDGKLGS